MAYDPTIIEPVTQEVDAQKSTVQGQMTGLLDGNSDYMKQAKTGAMQQANKSGLLNSTMAATAGQSAAIKSALPIAQADASVYNNQALANQSVQNNFLQANQAQEFNKANVADTFDYQTQLNNQSSSNDQNRDRLASQLDLVSSQNTYQQNVETNYLAAVTQSQQQASADAAMVARTEGLTSEQQTAAMNKIYAQAGTDQASILNLFRSTQNFSW